MFDKGLINFSNKTDVCCYMKKKKLALLLFLIWNTNMKLSLLFLSRRISGFEKKRHLFSQNSANLESCEWKKCPLLSQPCEFKEKLPDKNISTFTPEYHPCFQTFKITTPITSRKINCGQINWPIMDINTSGINHS